MMATGNIQKRKRKNGYAWEITVETPPDPVTKKRNRTSKTVRGTKKEAEQMMRQMIADAEKGYHVSPAVRTWYLSPFKVAELLPKAEDSKDDSKKHSKGKGKTAAKEGESKRTSLP